jgi:hypothetical protein
MNLRLFKIGVICFCLAYGANSENCENGEQILKYNGNISAFALLIGIDHYNHPNINNLNSCVIDVNNLSKLLCSQGYFVYTLIDSLANYKTIVKTLKIIVNRAHKQDRILFYFSGHGDIQFSKVFLILNQAPTASNYSGPSIIYPLIKPVQISVLPYDEIADKLGKIEIEQKIIITDACYTGWGKLPSIKINSYYHPELTNNLFLSINTLKEPILEHIYTNTLINAWRLSADSLPYGNSDNEVDAWETIRYMNSVLKKFHTKNGKAYYTHYNLVGTGKMVLTKW